MLSFDVINDDDDDDDKPFWVFFSLLNLNE